jgi:hypothetical protein
MLAHSLSAHRVVPCPHAAPCGRGTRQPVDPGTHFTSVRQLYRCFSALELVGFRPCRVKTFKPVEDAESGPSAWQEIDFAADTFRPCAIHRARVVTEVVQTAPDGPVCDEPRVKPLQQFVGAESLSQRSVHKQSRARGCFRLSFVFHVSVPRVPTGRRSHPLDFQDAIRAGR